MGIIVSAGKFSPENLTGLPKPIIYCVTYPGITDQAVSLNIRIARMLETYSAKHRTMQVERCFHVIQEYAAFKGECSSLVSYMTSIEYLDLGVAFKEEMESAKSAFRTIRDSIADGTSGEAASLKVSEQLEKVKEKYISIYFEEHKKKRLDIDDAKRRGKLQESRALANLKKLRTIEILSGAKLTAIEQDMSELKVCYDLTPVELRTNPICPHCRYSIGDKAKNIYG